MNALADTINLDPAELASFNSRPRRNMSFVHAPGDVVLGRYTIRCGIGMGGFGEVYFAVSEAGKEVALKRIQRNLEVELRGVSHCLNLKHPHLVSLHDICRDAEDQAWVVMEYVAGPNLRHVLDQATNEKPASTGRLARSRSDILPSGLHPEQVRQWFSGMASGVGHLHRSGLVHRDLKPGNIFDDDGVVKVGDYGLSKFISSSHRGGHTESVGTFHYMAPEIGRGNYDQLIDVYAMGVMLFEMVTGEIPFDGESPQEIIVKHLTNQPNLDGVPKPYRPAIAACLQKDPALRPGNVDELLGMLGWSERHAASAHFAGVDSSQTSPVTASVVEPVMARVVDKEAPNASVPNPEDGAWQGSGETQPAVTLSSPSHEEPIARAIRTSFHDLSRWWATLERSPGSKAFMIIATGLIFLINTSWLIPVLSMVAVFYLPYYVIRHMILQINHGETYAEANRLATTRQPAPVPPTPKMTKAQLRLALRDSLATRSSLCRWSEWSTSGMTSMIVAATLLLVTSVIGLRNEDLNPVTLSPYVWMTSVIWAGGLMLLSVGKWWERSEGEGLHRRFASALVGAALGVTAFVAAEFLMIPLDAGLGRDIDATVLPTSFYAAAGHPKAAAMMAHFAALFALLRMWKPVDPLRRSRLSLWAVAVAVVGEWLVHQFVPIPQPYGMLIAGGLVVMTQMAAPWVKSDTLVAPQRLA
ncbi:MAG: serine/threonine-protein kinase [Planctomycetota bacterium]